MRYSKNETTYILAEFTSGDTVIIDIYRLNDDVKVVDSGVVSEISSTGTFKYLFNLGVTEKTEFLLIMSNGIIDKRGKLILGGYPDDIEDTLGSINTDVSFIKEIEGGRWKIDPIAKQMIFYGSDNITEVATFDLLDSSGDATSESVFERVRV